MMKKNFLIFSILVAFLIGCPLTMAQSIDDLTLMTEYFPPFNYKEDHELKGISVDIMERMLEMSGSHLTRDDIHLLPWARAYRNILERPHTVLFLMNRNKAREKLFKWVGPVIPAMYVLIAKKDRGIRIKTLEDLKKYRIGVVSKDLSEQLLREIGIHEQNIDRVASGEVNLMKLNRGRIDLWNYEASVAKWIISKSGFRMEDYEVAYVLKTELSSHYAFHRDTSDEIIERFQQALDKLKEKGPGEAESEYDLIIKRHINNASGSYPMEDLTSP